MKPEYNEFQKKSLVNLKKQGTKTEIKNLEGFISIKAILMGLDNHYGAKIHPIT